MGACVATGAALVVESRIGVGGQVHSAGAEEETVSRICVDIVEQVVHGSCCICSCCGLLGDAEGNEELVFDGPRVVDQGSDDTLRSFDARFVESQRSIFVRCQLLLGAVDDFAVLVGRELRLCRCLVPFAKQQVSDVVFH